MSTYLKKKKTHINIYARINRLAAQVTIIILIYNHEFYLVLVGTKYVLPNITRYKVSYRVDDEGNPVR